MHVCLQCVSVGVLMCVWHLTCQGLNAGALEQLGAGTLRLPEPRADWSVVVVELALGFRVVQVWGGISHRAQRPATHNLMFYLYWPHTHFRAGCTCMHIQTYLRIYAKDSENMLEAGAIVVFVFLPYVSLKHKGETHFDLIIKL